MNFDVIMGLVRHLLTFVGGILVSRGLIDAGVLEQAIGAVITLAGAAWSVVNKNQLKPPDA